MCEVISKTLKIITPVIPPDINFIEQEIIKNNVEPLRWAIVEIESNCLTVSVSGRELKC